MLHYLSQIALNEMLRMWYVPIHSIGGLFLVFDTNFGYGVN